jgi:hypothetical protein
MVQKVLCAQSQTLFSTTGRHGDSILPNVFLVLKELLTSVAPFQYQRWYTRNKQRPMLIAQLCNGLCKVMLLSKLPPGMSVFP